MLNSPKINPHLTHFKGLDLSALPELFVKAKARHIPAGEIYINEKSNYQKVAYITKGLIRAYQLKENGDEITLMFRWEDQLVASYDSIFFQTPSKFIYKAIEDTVLMEIDYNLSQEMTDNSPRLAGLRNAFLMQMLSETLVRIETFILLSPEERYIKLVREKPDIVNRVTDKHLATSLGITPVTLSRIRKRIISPKKH